MKRIVRVFWLASAVALASCSHSSNELGQLTVRSRMDVAAAALSSGDKALAASMLAGAAEASPDRADVQQKYARSLAELGDVHRAQLVLNKALQRHPNDYGLRYETARLAVVMGNFSEAMAGFDALLAGNPRDARVLTSRGVALDLLGRSEEAQAAFQQALAIEPHYVAAENNLGLSIVLQGRVQEGKAMLEDIRQTAIPPPRVAANLAFAASALTGEAAVPPDDRIEVPEPPKKRAKP